MKCIICKQGETQQDKTTTTLERKATTIVCKNGPFIEFYAIER